MEVESVVRAVFEEGCSDGLEDDRIVELWELLERDEMRRQLSEG
ncbi:MAG TPA: hypothetical protein VMP13_06420 [Acidimicrobiia bacterium]|nr:hypothetical protein [Acidimicrobiia bacterium]